MNSFVRSMQIIKKELKEFQAGVGQEHYGVATYIIDPHNFYIVPLMCHRNMSLLEKHGSSYVNVHESAIVIYLSPTFDHYVRGQVQKVESNKTCEIFAMDYGITECVNHHRIYTPLHKEATNIPPLAQLCGLFQCYPPGKGGKFTELQINVFKGLMGEEEKLTVTIRHKTSTKLAVDIMSSASNPQNISTVMFITNHTSYLPSL